MHRLDFRLSHLVGRDCALIIAELPHGRPQGRCRRAQGLPLPVAAPPIEDLAEDLAPRLMDGVCHHPEGGDILLGVWRGLARAAALMHHHGEDDEPAPAIAPALSALPWGAKKKRAGTSTGPSLSGVKIRGYLACMGVSRRFCRSLLVVIIGASLLVLQAGGAATFPHRPPRRNPWYG